MPLSLSKRAMSLCRLFRVTDPFNLITLHTTGINPRIVILTFITSSLGQSHASAYRMSLAVSSTIICYSAYMYVELNFKTHCFFSGARKPAQGLKKIKGPNFAEKFMNLKPLKKCYCSSTRKKRPIGWCCPRTSKECHWLSGSWNKVL